MVIDNLEEISSFFNDIFTNHNFSKNVLNDCGNKCGVAYVDATGSDNSLVEDDDKRGFVFEIRSGNLLFSDDCWCWCWCWSSSFLLSDEDNLSFERCCWW